MTEYVYRVVVEVDPQCWNYNFQIRGYCYGGTNYHYDRFGKPFTSKGSATSALNKVKKAKYTPEHLSTFYIERAPVPSEWTRI